MRKLHGADQSSKRATDHGPAPQPPGGARLAGWLLLGFLLSLITALISYDLVASTGVPPAQAVVAASGTASTFATLYVSVLAFVKGGRHL